MTYDHHLCGMLMVLTSNSIYYAIGYLVTIPLYMYIADLHIYYLLIRKQIYYKLNLELLRGNRAYIPLCTLY